MVGTCGRDRVVVTNRDGELLAAEGLPVSDERTICDLAFSNTEPAFGVVWRGPVIVFSKYLLEPVD